MPTFSTGNQGYKVAFRGGPLTARSGRSSSINRNSIESKMRPLAVPTCTSGSAPKRSEHEVPRVSLRTSSATRREAIGAQVQSVSNMPYVGTIPGRCTRSANVCFRRGLKQPGSDRTQSLAGTPLVYRSHSNEIKTQIIRESPPVAGPRSSDPNRFPTSVDWPGSF